MNDEIKNAPELQCEEFVGMWADCDEMADSSAWIRKLRENERAK